MLSEKGEAYELLREKMDYRSPHYFEARVQEQLHTLRELLGAETYDQNWRMGVYTPFEDLLPASAPQILLCENT